MTQPTTYGNRLAAPPSGSAEPERLVARFRGHARRLGWSALVLVAVAGATAFFYDNLPQPLSDIVPVPNVALLSAAALVLLLLVIFPWIVWLSRTYTITTRRIIARTGVFSRRRREYAHARGYGIDVRRGPLQRMWRSGTITLTNGIDQPLQLVNIPDVVLVQETLADQVEVSQILAHRDARVAPADAVIPPRPPAPGG